MLVVDYTLINNFIYILGFCIIFYVTFQILRATRLDELFKQGRIWQIRLTYIFICIIVSHLIMSAILRICQTFLIQ